MTEKHDSSTWNTFEDVDTRTDMDDEHARRYEEACRAAVLQHLPHVVSQMRALGREPVEVRLVGTRPTTKIVATYRTNDGAIREAALSLWGRDQIASSNPRHLGSPLDVAAVLSTDLSEPGSHHPLNDGAGSDK